MSLITLTAIKHNGLVVPQGIRLDETSLNFSDEEIQALIDSGGIHQESRQDEVIREALAEEGLTAEEDEDSESETAGLKIVHDSGSSKSPVGEA